MARKSVPALRERPFTYQALPGRVVFGFGTLRELGTELGRLGIRRALVVATPGRRAQAEAIAAAIAPRAAGLVATAAMHTPVPVTEAAVARLRELDADGIVAVGGGSAVGLGKALALRTGLPQVVVPTTYAGSEMTPVLGETANGAKTTRSDPRILPETVIYDVELTLGLPPAIAATSGLNAVAHAVEALYARERNPITSLMAERAIAAFARALPAIVADPSDRDARAAALEGAWLCGTCLGAVGMALHHKLCHALGGMLGLPHAETHAIVLPHATAYNAGAAPDAMGRIAAALGTDDAAMGLWSLAGRIGAPRALRDLGMPEDGIARAASAALLDPYWNPRPVERTGVEALLRRAWAGEPPVSAEA